MPKPATTLWLAPAGRGGWSAADRIRDAHLGRGELDLRDGRDERRGAGAERRRVEDRRVEALLAGGMELVDDLALDVRGRSSCSGSVIGPKMSSCILPRIFMPAPWITRILGILVLRSRWEMAVTVAVVRSLRFREFLRRPRRPAPYRRAGDQRADDRRRPRPFALQSCTEPGARHIPNPAITRFLWISCLRCRRGASPRSTPR
jgi:hypothetical protein